MYEDATMDKETPTKPPCNCQDGTTAHYAPPIITTPYEPSRGLVEGMVKGLAVGAMFGVGCFLIVVSLLMGDE